MLNEAEQNVIPFLRRPHVRGGDRPGRARTPSGPEPVEDVERLRRQVRQQEHALARLADALVAMRRGNEALRQENRELRLELEAMQRVRAAPDRPARPGT